MNTYNLGEAPVRLLTSKKCQKYGVCVELDFVERRTNTASV